MTPHEARKGCVCIGRKGCVCIGCLAVGLASGIAACHFGSQAGQVIGFLAAALALMGLFQ